MGISKLIHEDLIYNLQNYNLTVLNEIYLILVAISRKTNIFFWFYWVKRKSFVLLSEITRYPYHESYIRSWMVFKEDFFISLFISTKLYMLDKFKKGKNCLIILPVHLQFRYRDIIIIISKSSSIMIDFRLDGSDELTSFLFPRTCVESFEAKSVIHS